MAAPFAIEAENIYFSYAAEPPVLRGLSMRAARGEFVCVLGHSGCGKSTLLNIVMGLLRPSSGTVRVNGDEIRGPGTDRAIVFQDYSLFPWMTALGNAAFAARHARKISKAEAASLAGEYLAQVGMYGDRAKYPHQLSGGMRQRVAIARALAMDAGTWLFDEPFSALDPRMRRSLQTLVGEAAKRGTGRTVLFVTHNVDEAVTLGERILFMDGGAIRREVPVPFGYPRVHKEITGTREYFSLVSRLAEYFCEAGGRRAAER